MLLSLFSAREKVAPSPQADTGIMGVVAPLASPPSPATVSQELVLEHASASKPITGLAATTQWITGLQLADTQRTLEQAIRDLQTTAPSDPEPAKAAAQPVAAPGATQAPSLYLRWGQAEAHPGVVAPDARTVRVRAPQAHRLAVEHPEHVGAANTIEGAVRATAQTMVQLRETGRLYAASDTVQRIRAIEARSASTGA